MFPQIAKRKRKEFVFEEGVTRQAEEALKDLDLRTKAALKRIPPHILQDFSKVCRVKSIPEFYVHYFITSTQRTDPQRLSEVYGEEIERLLTNSSHFHRINQALRQREELIEGLRNSLVLHPSCRQLWRDSSS
jgi:enamine deaminase RidA (YjgF/YER057c/UK114 family)